MGIALSGGTVVLPIVAVSIQLISPASGNVEAPKLCWESDPVSIQLISPASGNESAVAELVVISSESFHSINIPSEWE